MPYFRPHLLLVAALSLFGLAACDQDANFAREYSVDEGEPTVEGGEPAREPRDPVSPAAASARGAGLTAEVIAQSI